MAATSIFVLLLALGMPLGSVSYAGSPQGIPVGHRLDLGGKGGPLHLPAMAVFGPEGNIYVLDGAADYVKVFSRSGKLLKSFGKRTGGEEALKDPLGIRVTRSGDVFVTDSGNRRIAVFGKDGAFRYAFPVRPDRYSVPADPTDLVVDEARGRCFIVDNGNHRIVVYGKDGEPQGAWGQVGYGSGEFRYPFRIARDPAGDLFVTDVINTRVQIFSSDGAYRGSLGEWGVEAGQFFRPGGIAVDAKGRIHVADSYLGVVQVFDRRGAFLGLLTDKGGNRAAFRSPTALAVSPESLLAVTESLANRVGIYALER
jgi:DNA-binding beta-propeller fold protein YncE